MMNPFRRHKSDSKVVPRIPTSDKFRMPPEEYPHEGTWLQWPHNFGWDPDHVQRYEATWIAMTQALHTGEKVHIIVYNDAEQERVQHILSQPPNSMDMTQIDFYTFHTDDVWVRDNGPIFVFDTNSEDEEELCITNWIFNAWGGKADDYYDNYVPLKVGHALELPVMDVPMVLEGGSIEVDGRGTLMAKRSSILNANRNKGWTQQDAERFFSHYLGVTNFIWLDGKKGGSDITDDHIDGTARFANGDTIVTFYKEDFVAPKEYKILQNAKDAQGQPYKMVHLPCTKHKLKRVGDYGIYTNFYVANKVVLVPAFDDPNDKVAMDKLARLYPTRQAVGIPCTEVYRDGGLVHCITQQQPAKQRK
ncbi:Putative agmatine deiminase [Seminavis robusta]|uniref:Agmatine deiminase n=1 Tax=Seminavis robusta TaxID=568900 RepID=A0A9N8ESH1_9STRA|nr:Putative agmatine deiminase [Seminavis robusta]|eukprot:Sro1826_g300140.1 Putative agmatine deiminase (362) ;mRNA; f:13654-14739